MCVGWDGNRFFHGESVGFGALEFGHVDGRSVGEVHACDAVGYRLAIVAVVREVSMWLQGLFTHNRWLD